MSEDSFSDVEEIQLTDETKYQVERNGDVPRTTPLADLPGFVDFKNSLTDAELDEDIKCQKTIQLTIDTQKEHETKMKYTILSSLNHMDSAPKTLATGLNMHQMHRELKQDISGANAVEIDPKQIETIAIGDSETTKKEKTVFVCQGKAWDEQSLNELKQKRKRFTLMDVFIRQFANLTRPKVTKVREISAADLAKEDGDKKKVGALQRLFNQLSCMKGSVQVKKTTSGINKGRDDIKPKKSLKKTWSSLFCCVGTDTEFESNDFTCTPVNTDISIPAIDMNDTLQDANDKISYRYIKTKEAKDQEKAY